MEGLSPERFKFIEIPGEWDMSFQNRVLTTLSFLIFFISSPVLADITGVWSTVDDKSHVKIEPCGNKICGTIVWLKEPNTPDGTPKVDANNTEEELKKRPILGLELLNGFEPVSKTEWDDGTIYNPEDGKTYSSTLTLSKQEELQVEGCVMVFCKTQVWKKVE
jgi:uncharacterized protein (DUF2147 family)